MERGATTIEWLTRDEDGAQPEPSSPLTTDEARARWTELLGRPDGVAVTIVSRESGRLVVAVHSREDMPAAALSRRELEVLRLTAQGRGVKEVANALGIASSTAGSHLASAMKKIGARRLAEVIVLFG